MTTQTVDPVARLGWQAADCELRAIRATDPDLKAMWEAEALRYRAHQLLILERRKPNA